MKRPALWTLAMLAAVGLAYSNHFQNGFHFDDSHTVLDNHYIRSLGNIPRFFRDATTFSVLPANRTYRPFVSASLAIDYSLGGGYIPAVFHISTFLLFLAQLILMLALFRAVLDRASPDTREANRYTALFCAAFYGLHPAIAETVNYVIQRGDIFSAAGVIAALVIYIRAPQIRWTQLYLLPFAFALLSKPPSLVFPVLLFFYALYFEETPRGARALAALKAAVPSLVVCGLLLWLQAAMTPKSFTPSILSPWSYRMTQPYVWLRYFEAFFLPIHLNVDTDLRAFTAVEPRMLAGLGFMLALLIAIVATARKLALRPISFGLVWFVLAQLPTSLYPLSEVENDHRMYLAFVGLVLALGASGALLLRGFLSGANALSRQRAVAALLVLVLAGYARGTFARNQVWRDDVTLWKDDVEKSPTNGRGLMNYGLSRMALGDFQQAYDLFVRALKFVPNYPVLEINLGIASDALSREDEWERHYKRAIALAPSAGDGHLYYGLALLAHHRLLEAKSQAGLALSANNSLLRAWHLLIQVDQALGDDREAKEAGAKALALAPADAFTQRLIDHPAQRTAADWLEISLRQYQEQRFGECIQSASLALAVKPDYAEAYNNLAAAHAALGHWDEAQAAARRAIELKPDFQLAKNNLAWAITGAAASPRSAAGAH